MDYRQICPPKTKLFSIFFSSYRPPLVGAQAAHFCFFSSAHFRFVRIWAHSHICLLSAPWARKKGWILIKNRKVKKQNFWKIKMSFAKRLLNIYLLFFLRAKFRRILNFSRCKIILKHRKDNGGHAKGNASAHFRAAARHALCARLKRPFFPLVSPFFPLHAKEEAKSKNGKVARIPPRVCAGVWQRMLANMPAAAPRADFSHSCAATDSCRTCAEGRRAPIM